MNSPEQIFASTASYYARYRAGYAPELFTHLAARLGLDGGQRILDLATGTGVLALPLSCRVKEVVAVDPEPGMLEEATRIACERRRTNIDWRLGDSSLLGQMDFGAIDHAVIGTAFHWMDRDRTLYELDRLIAPEGSVVVAFRGAPANVPLPDWLDLVSEIRVSYLGPERKAAANQYFHLPERHQDVLARSAFSTLETRAWNRVVRRTLDHVIGLQFSFSYSSPALLGNRKDAFERDLRAALAPLATDGLYDEPVFTEAVIASRPL